MPTHSFFNPRAATFVDSQPPSRAPLAFHQRLPGYTPTPLVDAPELAARLGVRQVWVKDESQRMGLPAFKILGAAWATYCALVAQLGDEPAPWATLPNLARQLAHLRPLTLAAATDGNHGRAVARMARLLKLDAHIFMPQDSAHARIDAIASEGARVTLVNGTYDDAVAHAANEAGPRCLVISDTPLHDEEQAPRRVIEGYGTILWEIDEQLRQHNTPGPDLVAVQIGVGALAAAVVAHYRRMGSSPGPRLIGVEPESAACVLASVRAGQLVEVPGPHPSIMAGLNCGRPSPIALPVLSSGIDLFTAISDERAREAMRALARAGITAGETGGAGLGGLLEALTGEHATSTRATLGVTATTRVLLFCTEGATDPDSYARIVGAPPEK